MTPVNNNPLDSKLEKSKVEAFSTVFVGLSMIFASVLISAVLLGCFIAGVVNVVRWFI